MFHDSLTPDDFFFFSITLQTSVERLSYVTLQDPPTLSCFLHLHSTSELGFSDTACDSCCENLLHMQKKKSKPRILRKNFLSLLFSEVSSTDIETL